MKVVISNCFLYIISLVIILSFNNCSTMDNHSRTTNKNSSFLSKFSNDNIRIILPDVPEIEDDGEYYFQIAYEGDIIKENNSNYSISFKLDDKIIRLQPNNQGKVNYHYKLKPSIFSKTAIPKSVIFGYLISTDILRSISNSKEIYVRNIGPIYFDPFLLPVRIHDKFKLLTSNINDPEIPELFELLGIHVEDITNNNAYHLSKGTFVKLVEEKGLADQAGLPESVVLLSIGDIEIINANTIYRALRDHNSNTVSFIYENASNIKKDITIDFEPKDYNSEIIDNLGLKLINTSKSIRNEFNVENGIYVERVKSNSPADKMEFPEKAVILKVGNEDITSVKNFVNYFQNNYGREVDIIIKTNKKRKLRLGMKIGN